MKNRLRSISAVLACLFIGGQAALADSHFDDGVRYLNRKQYAKAVVELARASGIEPMNAAIHYYLANALAHIREHDQAADEYRLCYVLNPTGPMADYCKQALIGYKKRVPTNEEARKEFDAICGAHRIAVKTGGIESASATQQAKTNGIHEVNSKARRAAHTPVGIAHNLIDRQVVYEKTKHKVISDAHAQSALSNAEDEAKYIQAQAQAEINKLYQPLIYPGPRVNPLLSNPELLKEREEQILNAAKDEQSRLKRQAEGKAGQYKAWAKQKEEVLDEVAQNLKQQMVAPQGHSGVRLQPIGTDLYVRYYGSGGNSKLPEVRPAVLRIYSRGPETPMRADSDEAQENIGAGPDSGLHVRGKVLK